MYRIRSTAPCTKPAVNFTRAEAFEARGWKVAPPRSCNVCVNREWTNPHGSIRIQLRIFFQPHQSTQALAWWEENDLQTEKQERLGVTAVLTGWQRHHSTAPSDCTKRTQDSSVGAYYASRGSIFINLPFYLPHRGCDGAGRSNLGTGNRIQFLLTLCSRSSPAGMRSPESRGPAGLIFWDASGADFFTMSLTSQ